MIPQPKRIAPDLVWNSRHLYRVWPGTGRRQYVGSIVRHNYPGRWAAWRRGEYMGSFPDTDGARRELEEFARKEDET